MTLTARNMRTDATGMTLVTAAMYEDVTRMDSGQLSNYVHLSFMGKQDHDFLPIPFWNRHFSVSGSPRQPGEFFGDLYRLVPKMVSGEFTRHDGSRIHPDQAYRSRLEGEISDILRKGTSSSRVTREKKMLSYFAVQTAERIIFESDEMLRFGLIRGFAPPEGISRTEQFPIERIPGLAQNQLFGLVQNPKYHDINFNYTTF